ncbi:MAG: DUF4097 family beta strand repeat-containing protein [Xanthomonadales bacterium]|nr:DUF4097 family beta strand repeat-containing protein [Xanthomonadales bacterium]
MKQLIRAITLLALFFTGAAAADHDQAVNRTIEASADGEVRIENVSGTITVEGWDREEVQVTGTLEEGVERLEVDDEDGYIKIKVKVRRSGRDKEADLLVKLPAASRVRISGIRTDIDVSDVTGPLRLNAISGDISVESRAESFQLETVSGDIRVEGSDKEARMTVESVSGEINVDDLDGEITGGTVSGDLGVRGGSVKRANLDTTSGDLTFATEIVEDGVYDFEAVNGDITLVTRGEPDARFDITSFNGEINNDYGPDPERVSEYGPGVELQFTSGSGDAEVRINTLNGEIYLDER